jgi:hypothetical protein
VRWLRRVFNRLSGLHQADQARKVVSERGFERGITGTDFVLHAARFKTVEIGVLHIEMASCASPSW